MAINPAPFVALNGLTAAATPPVYNAGNGYGIVPKEWQAGGVDKFHIEVHAVGSNAVTAAKLVGAVPEVLAALSDDNIDSVSGADITMTGHAYYHGDGPVRLTTSGTLPTGLALATNYWLYVKDANTVQFCDSLERALKGQGISVSGGSGTHTAARVAVPTAVDTNPDAPTKRLKWLSIGLLGEAADGSMTLTISMGWQGLARHNMNVVAYSLVGTFGSAVATTVTLRPALNAGT
jgi:hypothetical protein